VNYSFYRLTKFETRLSFQQWSDSTERGILNFFTAQKALKIISLTVSRNAEETFIKELMFCILEKCPNLREFYFHYDGGVIHLNTEEVNHYFALIPKLSFISTDVDFEVVHMPVLSSSNLAASVLDLSGRTGGEVYVNLLKRCTGLKHLRLINPSESLAQEALKLMVQLIMFENMHLVMKQCT